MPLSLRCSHVLCKVDDLHAAVRDYRELGFTVEWGSDPQRAHNALICFTEGPFLELFSPPRLPTALRWAVTMRYGKGVTERLDGWARAGQGWRDVAVETDDADLSNAVVTLRASGLPMSAALRRRRTTPDGNVIRWQLSAPQTPSLPFLMSAYTPPQRPREIVHPNGAQAVSMVEVGVMDSAREQWDALVDGDDPWLRPVPAAAGVRSVTVRGLTGELDPAKLHGAVLLPAAG